MTTMGGVSASPNLLKGYAVKVSKEIKITEAQRVAILESLGLSPDVLSCVLYVEVGAPMTVECECPGESFDDIVRAVSLGG